MHQRGKFDEKLHKLYHHIHLITIKYSGHLLELTTHLQALVYEIGYCDLSYNDVLLGIALQKVQWLNGVALL